MESLKWVAGWALRFRTQPKNFADYIKDQTFRYVIFPTHESPCSASCISQKRYGTENVTIDKVYLAQRAAGEFVDRTHKR